MSSAMSRWFVVTILVSILVSAIILPTYGALPTDDSPTSNYSPTDDSPTTVHSPTDDSPTTAHSPTDDSPTTDHSPTDDSPTTDHLPTDDSPTTAHSPTDDSPTTDHSPTDDSPTSGYMSTNDWTTENGQTTVQDNRPISEKIWAADRNRMSETNVVYNNSPNAQAGDKLFAYVNDTALIGTYKKLTSLLKCRSERENRYCCYEIHAFLDAIISTGPIITLYNWLVDNGYLTPNNPSGFKELLYQYWFEEYSRYNELSSGFEHVFRGDINAYNSNNYKITGFHNWVQAYIDETSGEFEKQTYGNTCPPAVEAFYFIWRKSEVKYSSMFMRTSPEVEIALYTYCFMTNPGKSCPVHLEGKEVFIKTFEATAVDFTTIGTAYPDC